MASVLSEEKFSALNNAVKNVLGTEVAVEAYAQIIDGLPHMEKELWYGRRIDYRHPLRSHKQLCPGVMDQLRQYRAGFDLSQLSFDHMVLEQFEAAESKSRTFELRLLELTAEAIHQVAVYLFQQGNRLHDPSTTQGLDVEGVRQWQAEKVSSFAADIPPLHNLFMHAGFYLPEQYPHGVADVVGYWAEDFILGGVILFDRSRSWNDRDQEPNAYLYASRHPQTEIAQLTDEQQKRLVDFLTADQGHAADTCPLPILVSDDDNTFIDGEFGMNDKAVYRNMWEVSIPADVDRKWAAYRNHR